MTLALERNGIGIGLIYASFLGNSIKLKLHVLSKSLSPGRILVGVILQFLFNDFYLSCAFLCISETVELATHMVKSATSKIHI